MADLSNGSSHPLRKAILVRPFSGRATISKPLAEVPQARPAAPPFAPRLSLPQQTVSLPTPVTSVAISWTESAIDAIDAQESDVAEAGQQLAEFTIAECAVEQDESPEVLGRVAEEINEAVEAHHVEVAEAAMHDETYTAMDDALAPVDEGALLAERAPENPMGAAASALEAAVESETEDVTEEFETEPAIELADSIEVETLTIEESDNRWPEDVPSLELASEEDEAFYATPSEPELELPADFGMAVDAEAPLVGEKPELPGERHQNTGSELASMLEAVAARVRAGEIPVSASATRNEAAALASVLAALLGHPD